MNREELKNKMQSSTAKGLKKQFPGANKKSIKWLMKNAHKIVKMYNNFCPSCKRLAQADPSRPASDYCNECQSVAKKYIEK